MIWFYRVLETGRVINKHWLMGYGISDISEIPNELYAEYVVANYGVNISETRRTL